MDIDFSELVTLLWTAFQIYERFFKKKRSKNLKRKKRKKSKKRK